MRIPSFRSLALLALAGAFAAGCRDASRTPVAPDDPLQPVAVTDRTQPPAFPLVVDMECQANGGDQTCAAAASGGSGTGYSFTWTNSHGYTSEYYDQDGYSEAEAACYGSYGQETWATVTATVTDSNGATASKSRMVSCGY